MASPRLLANLIARYKLDCNALDSKGVNHGTWTGAEAWEQLSNGSFAATFNGVKKITYSTPITFESVAYRANGIHYVIVSGSTYYTKGIASAPFTARVTTTDIGDGYTGSISDVRFFNVALTADEVSELYVDSKQRVKTIVPLPTALWKLDGTAKDAIGSNDLTPQSAMGYEKTNKGEYQATFAGGASNYYQSATPAVSGKTFTIEFLISRKGTMSAFESYFSQYTAGGVGRFIIFTVSTGSIIVAVTGTNYATSAVNVIKQNRRHHVLISCNAGQPTIYVDGRSVATPSGTFTDDVLAVAAKVSHIAASTWAMTGAMGRVGVYNGTALNAAQAWELYIRSKYPIKKSQPIQLVSGGTIPTNRQNELFSTIDGQDDRSTYGATITRVSPAISVDGAMRFNGSAGAFSVADKIGVGDISLYFTVYAKTTGTSGYGRIFENGKFRIQFNVNGTVAVTSDGAVTRNIINTSILLIPKRIAVIRKSSGLTTCYVNGVESMAEISTGVPAAATTALFIGNRSANDRAHDGEISLVRINSGIDTLEQIQEDNRIYGF